MRSVILNLGFALGVLVAAFGLAVDAILPGSSPGFNLPQILIIAAGALLAVGSRRLRRDGLPRWLGGAARKNLARGFAVAIVTLLALEIILTALGAPTYYPTELSEAPLEQASWWTCDELGCRFVYDAVVSACDSGILSERACIVNRQGFADRDEFAIDERADGRRRILMLGDSFTQGYSADVGHSFVERLEADLPDALVWNAGIGGTGSNQAVATFAGLGPLFKPHLTVLGFFSNDFHDNLFPLDSKLRFTNADGSIEAVRYYVLDQNGKPVRLELTAGLVAFARAGKLPIPNELERLLGNTRLGSLLLQLKQRIEWTTVSNDPHFVRATALTREYMSALQENAASVGSELLVLVIPFRPDLTPPAGRYETLIEILHDLEIAYLDPSDIILAPGDFAAHPDVHWNNSGHQKVGALLSQCIKAFNEGGALANCPHVTAPSGG